MEGFNFVNGSGFNSEIVSSLSFEIPLFSKTERVSRLGRSSKSFVVLLPETALGWV